MGIGLPNQISLKVPSEAVLGELENMGLPCPCGSESLGRGENEGGRMEGKDY